MIKIYYVEGRYAPRVVCDACEQPIEEAKLGVAVNPSDTGSGRPLDVLHAHKGPCHSAIEARLGGRMNTGWSELSHHLLHVCQNSNLHPQALVGLNEQLREFGL